MSTRSIVKVIEGNRAIEFYHHSDGYLEGLGFFLLKEMDKVIKEEPLEYAHGDSMMSKWVKEYDFQPTLANHADIEYYYEFDIDNKKVRAKAVNNWDLEMKTLEEYDLESYYQKHKEDDVNLYGE